MNKTAAMVSGMGIGAAVLIRAVTNAELSRTLESPAFSRGG